jgi:cell division protein FtsZ
VLLSIQGGSDLGLFEINEAAQLVANSAATEANIIFGAVIDDALGDEVRVTVIAAGFDEPQPGRARPRTTAYSAAPYSASPTSAAQTPATASPAGGQSEWRPFQLGDARPAAPGEAAQAAAADASRPPAPVNGGPPASASGDIAHSPAAESAMSDAAKAEHIPQPRHASPDDPVESEARDGQSGASRTGANGRPDTTRRKSVVFEEDDELDVPDFLK